MTARYSIDTSAIVELWRGLYSRDVFPSAWEQFEVHFDNGILIAPDEVYRELKDASDDLSEWVKLRSDRFYPLDDALQQHLRKVISPFPQAASIPKRYYADPHVVALADLFGCSVVSQESANDLTSNPNGLPQIPNYCSRHGVQHLPLLRMFREMGWQF